MHQTFPLIEPAHVKLSDGAAYSLQFNEAYYSDQGGIAEKTHVFLDGNQLRQRFCEKSNNQRPFIVAEIGFGLGLNFLLCWQWWERLAPAARSLHFISCELHPLTKVDLAAALAPIPVLACYKEALLAAYPPLVAGQHRLNFGNVSLTLMLGDALTTYRDLLCHPLPSLQQQLRFFAVDSWLLDGFSPKVNHSAWSQQLVEILAQLSKKGTTLASYSVACDIKGALAASGFKVSKRQGISHKKECLTAIFTGENKASVPFKHAFITPWAWPRPSKPVDKHASVAIIGGGLGGCLLAHTLSDTFQVSLFEQGSHVGAGASGNHLGLMHINFSSFVSPLSTFLISAYLYAQRFYQTLPLKEKRVGVLQLLQGALTKKQQQKYDFWLRYYPELLALLSPAQASELAGTHLPYQALYQPLSYVLSPQELCNYFITHAPTPITLYEKTPISQLEALPDGTWQVGGRQFAKVVIAAGGESCQFEQTAFLPLEQVSGELNYVAATQCSAALKMGVVGDNYLTPASSQGWHVVGGAFHVEQVDSQTIQQTYLDYLEMLNKKVFTFRQQALLTRRAFRAKSFDYLPYVGGVPIASAFKAQYQHLAKDKHYFINEPGHYHPNLYVLTGFGSHGLATIPLSVDYLACLMKQSPLPIPTSMHQSLSPARALIKALVAQK